MGHKVEVRWEGYEGGVSVTLSLTPCPWWEVAERTWFMPKCCQDCNDNQACRHAEIRAHCDGQHKRAPSDDCPYCVAEAT